MKGLEDSSQQGKNCKLASAIQRDLEGVDRGSQDST